jgi:glutamate-ammonia-ligase adenylyltransferase
MGRRHDPAKVISDVADMRARIAEAKGAGLTPFEAKLGPGHIQDIEMVAQAAALLSPDIPRGTEAQIAAGVAIGWFSAAEAEALRASYDLMWRLQASAKLLTDKPLDLETIGPGGLDLLLRETEMETGEALAGAVEELGRAAEEAIEAALKRQPGGEGAGNGAA